MFFTEAQSNEFAWALDAMKGVKSFDTEPIDEPLMLPDQVSHFPMDNLHSTEKRLSSSSSCENESEADNAEQIKLQIQAQADIVRRSFESSSKRKATSAATKAAAASMASANMRKRQKMTSLFPPSARELFSSAYPPQEAPQRQSSVRVANRFFSPISSLTTTLPKKEGQGRQAAPLPRDGDAKINTLIRNVNYASSNTMTLNSHPHTIYISNNDIICGKGPVTNNMVGNRRYCVLIDLHLHAFKKAVSKSDRETVARSIVHTVRQSVPSGKFLMLDVDSGLWGDIGDEKATASTLKELAMRSPPAPTHIRLPVANKATERRGGLPRAA